MTEKYQPSNGTEGEWFMAKWCAKCQRDKPMRDNVSVDDCAKEELCQILGKTMIYDVEDAEYPVEWVEDERGPRCTAFVPVGEPIPEPRCTKTKDMFEA